MKKEFILLIAIIAFTSVFTYQESEMIDQVLSKFEGGSTKTLFQVYHHLYKKEYLLESDEGAIRYNIFKKNYKFIQEENKKGNSYTLGITEFVDYTWEELEKYYLNEKIEDEWSGLRRLKQENSNFFDLPDEEEGENTMTTAKAPISEIITTDKASIDYRNLYTAGVRNQGQCGSCWAFSATATFEGNLRKIKPNLVNDTYFSSAQQVVDCDKNSGGCNGGWSGGALIYYIANTGLVADTAYPYTSGTTRKTGVCNSTIVSDSNIQKIKGGKVEYCDNCDFDKWYDMLSRGPLTISCYATSKWFYYKSGIFTHDTCASGSSNHAINAVGWGSETNAKGNKVWFTIIRNSWGAGWGEKGYMRVAYQPELKKSCFVNYRGTRNNFES